MAERSDSALNSRKPERAACPGIVRVRDQEIEAGCSSEWFDVMDKET